MRSHWLQIMFSDKLLNETAVFASMLWITNSSVQVYLK